MSDMDTGNPTVRRRGRSEQKRAAILDAAQELFAAGGFDLTSVDAIAARAGVSKRTVYDHFGDKENIRATVVDRLAEHLLRTVVAALEEDLPAGCDLRAGLLAFARRIASSTLSSAAYTQFRSLVGPNNAQQRVPGSMRNKPKELFTQRMESFAATGAIRTEDPGRAAEHFIALTLLLALDTVDTSTASSANALDSILVSGVDAFVRAYT
jgi:TetR/AcrR family transcriptional regulator, mexJK operon transcriptional repressor